MASIGTVDIQVRDPRERRLTGWRYDGYADDALAVEGAEHDASMFVNDGGAEPHLRGDARGAVRTGSSCGISLIVTGRSMRRTLDDRVRAIHVLGAVDGTNDLS